MKHYAKHILCLSVIILVIAGAGCKKNVDTSSVLSRSQMDSIYRADSVSRERAREDSIHRVDSVYLANRFDFRDSLTGRYGCEYHRTAYLLGPNGYGRDTILRTDTITVSKLTSDTLSVVINSKVYKYNSTTGNQITFFDFNYCRPLSATFTDSSTIKVWDDIGCIGLGGGGGAYYIGGKVQ